MLKLKSVVWSLLLGTVLLSSCDKCAKCTYYDKDKDETLETEFCERGHVYDDALEQHERNNWTCVED